MQAPVQAGRLGRPPRLIQRVLPGPQSPRRWPWAPCAPWPAAGPPGAPCGAPPCRGSLRGSQARTNRPVCPQSSGTYPAELHSSAPFPDRACVRSAVLPVPRPPPVPPPVCSRRAFSSSRDRWPFRSSAKSRSCRSLVASRAPLSQGSLQGGWRREGCWAQGEVLGAGRGVPAWSAPDGLGGTEPAPALAPALPRARRHRPTPRTGCAPCAGSAG